MIISAVVMWLITCSSRTPLPVANSVLPHGVDEANVVYKNRVTMYHVPCHPGVQSVSLSQTGKNRFALKDAASDVVYVVAVSFRGETVDLDLNMCKRTAVTIQDSVMSFPLFVDGKSSVGTCMTVTLALASSPKQILARGEFVVRAKITTPHAHEKRAERRQTRDKEYAPARQYRVAPSDRRLRSGSAFVNLTEEEINLFCDGLLDSF
jgi:hypothetical protein